MVIGIFSFCDVGKPGSVALYTKVEEFLSFISREEAVVNKLMFQKPKANEASTSWLKFEMISKEIFQ